mmetsp:Transcript_37236/g.99103  ORF Transcript_37236/g.99103 Transcript_37236/m.99103 type:complete len:392 (-) Transcript_37236:3362-4537(-)
MARRLGHQHRHKVLAEPARERKLALAVRRVHVRVRQEHDHHVRLDDPVQHLLDQVLTSAHPPLHVDPAHEIRVELHVPQQLHNHLLRRVLPVRLLRPPVVRPKHLRRHDVHHPAALPAHGALHHPHPLTVPLGEQQPAICNIERPGREASSFHTLRARHHRWDLVPRQQVRHLMLVEAVLAREGLQRRHRRLLARWLRQLQVPPRHVVVPQLQAPRPAEPVVGVGIYLGPAARAALDHVGVRVVGAEILRLLVLPEHKRVGPALLLLLGLRPPLAQVLEHLAEKITHRGLVRRVPKVDEELAVLELGHRARPPPHVVLDFEPRSNHRDDKAVGLEVLLELQARLSAAANGGCEADEDDADVLGILDVVCGKLDVDRCQVMIAAGAQDRRSE